MVERLIAREAQAWGESGLHQLITSDDLSGNLQAFLIACRVSDLAPATLQDYRQAIGAFVRFMAGMGVHQAPQITTQHLRLYILNRQQSCSGEGVRHYFRDVRRFLNFLAEEKIIERSPMAGWKQPKADRPMIKPFSTEQLRAMMAVCDGKFLGLRNAAILWTFIDTGLRLSELANIMLADLDFNHELITVTHAKGGKQRYVRMGKRAQKAILKYLLMRHDRLPDLWLTEERTPILSGGIYQMIHDLGVRAGVSGVRCSPHTLRHTSATLALQNGAREREVQELLGHSTAAMTKRYTATLQSKWAAESHKRFSPGDNLK